MPYALFSNDDKLSKAYPTAADVWKIASKSGLVVDVMSAQDSAGPRPVLDHDYEIKPCQLEPYEDPARNKAEAEAEREALSELQLAS
ncbi:MAG: hypothetical protein ABW175_12690 [Bradyrhizobium sp.]